MANGVTLKKKRYYYRVGMFAKGKTEGGTWENDVLIWNHSPEAAFSDVLSYLAGKGFAFEVTITHCRANGEDYQ